MEKFQGIQNAGKSQELPPARKKTVEMEFHRIGVRCSRPLITPKSRKKSFHMFGAENAGKNPDDDSLSKACFSTAHRALYDISGVPGEGVLLVQHPGIENPDPSGISRDLK